MDKLTKLKKFQCEKCKVITATNIPDNVPVCKKCGGKTKMEEIK